MLALAHGPSTPEDEEEEERPFYVPSQAKLQFAGNVGMLSLGGGWSFFDRKVELDLLWGWVPPMNRSGPIWTLTVKSTTWPLAIDLPRDWRIRPLSLGILASYTFGENYFLFLPSHYPRGYLPASTALRFGVFAGGSLGRSFEGHTVKGADIYWELGATDLEAYLVAVNPRSHSLFDALHLALGLSVSF